MQNRSVQVALIDPDSDSRRAIRGLLTPMVQPRFNVSEWDPAEFSLLDDPAPFDCLILGPGLDPRTGLELLEESQLRGVHSPVIGISESTSGTEASRWLLAGAEDFICRSRADGETLSNAVLEAIERNALRNEARLCADRLEARNEQLHQQSELIRTFYFTIARELRAPISSVSRLLGTLRSGDWGPLNEDQESFLDISIDKCGCLQTMTENLGLLAEIDRNEVELDRNTSSFAEFFSGLVENFRERVEAAELSFDVQEDGGELTGDLPLLGRIVSQLIDNAIRFTPPGGRVALEAVTDPEGVATISVHDSGAGIEPKEQERIFRRLQRQETEETTLHPGLGLGLSLCQELVKLHGGTLCLNSCPERGSQFSFKLPRKTGESQSSKERSAS